MRLCTNRPEGFGPVSHLFPNTLTSCFSDTILIPLCTWLYLLVILFLFISLCRRSTRRAYTTGIDLPSARKKNENGETSNTADTAIDETAFPNNSSSSAHDERRKLFSKTKIFRLTLRILYYVLLVAQTLMVILEITRLSLARLGIGLLPFTFISLLLALSLHLTNGFNYRIRDLSWRLTTIAAWLALAIVNGVKIAGEVKEGQAPEGGRKGSKYPESDEIIDVSVMVGVYLALAGLEITWL